MVIYSLIAIHKEIKEQLFYHSDPVLSYSVEYPQFSSHSLSIFVKRLNKYYQDKAFSFRNYCASSLYEEAKMNYEYSKANNIPFNMLEGIFNYNITYNQKCTLSTYTDEYLFKGGANGETTRYSDTWNLAIGNRFVLKDFIQIKEDCCGYIKDNIAGQIRLDTENSYFEDYEKLIEENFNPEQFYLTDIGLVIYFQPSTISPHFAGIRDFTFPYSIGNIIEPDCR